MKPTVDLLIEDIGRLVPGKTAPLEGASVAIDSGKIQAVGPARKLAGLFHPEQVIDASGKLVFRASVLGAFLCAYLSKRKMVSHIQTPLS